MDRTGRLLYAMGNIRASQGLLDESLSYHERAYDQLTATVGNNHHRTCDVSYRLADHYVRLGRSHEAMYVSLQHITAVSSGQVADPRKVSVSTILSTCSCTSLSSNRRLHALPSARASFFANLEGLPKPGLTSRGLSSCTKNYARTT